MMEKVQVLLVHLCWDVHAIMRTLIQKFPSQNDVSSTATLPPMSFFFVQEKGCRTHLGAPGFLHAAFASSSVLLRHLQCWPPCALCILEEHIWQVNDLAQQIFPSPAQ